MGAESDIETTSWQNAVACGWVTIKIERGQLNGWPDRLYLRGGRAVFIEYKAPGKKPTRQQLLRHAEIRAAGFEIYVCDSVEMSDAILCQDEL